MTALANSITYEPWGSITAAQYGNSLTLQQEWTEGRLASKRLTKPATSTDLSWLTYRFDNNDNVGAILDQLDETKSVYYGYDPNDRLALASQTVTSPAASSETYSYTSGKNRLASIVNASGTRSITYDARGNTSSESRPSRASVSVTYDGYGRLLTYNRTGSEAQTNAYSGLDDRVKVTAKFGGAKASARIYVYDPDGRLLGEYGASAAAPVAETIWMSPEVAANDNSPIGGDDGVGGYAPLAVAKGSGASLILYWVHGNHLGVPTVTTTSAGATATPTGFTMVGFPGQTRTLNDIYYNRYRDYDSSTGRYVQADPVGLEGGSNPYLYAEGNPLRWTDPQGLNPAAVRGAIVVGEAAGEGFVWWCRSNLALCARTVGPPIVRAANACNAFIKTFTDDNDHDTCDFERKQEPKYCERQFSYNTGALGKCRRRADINYDLCRRGLQGKWWTDADEDGISHLLPKPPTRPRRR